MRFDIKDLVSEVKENTGIEFSVYFSNGKLMTGAPIVEQTFPTFVSDDNVIEDDYNTYFCISFNGANYVGALKGNTQVEKKYAFFIRKLIESSAVNGAYLSSSEFCRAVLLGETTKSQAITYMNKYSIKDLPCFVLIVRIENGKASEVRDVLLTYGAEERDFVIEMSETNLAFIKFKVEDDDEYSSSTEYAEFLKQTVYEETGARVKIYIGGTVNTLLDLSSSYAQAMTTVRMSSFLSSSGDVHSYKEYVFYQILEDLPKSKQGEYLDLLSDVKVKEILADKELSDTAEEFLESSLNMSETARKMFVHRNTLGYRLDKIERETGLDIRKFSDAITFRLITILNKLVR